MRKMDLWRILKSRLSFNLSSFGIKFTYLFLLLGNHQSFALNAPIVATFKKLTNAPATAAKLALEDIRHVSPEDVALFDINVTDSSTLSQESVQQGFPGSLTFLISACDDDLDSGNNINSFSMLTPTVRLCYGISDTGVTHQLAQFAGHTFWMQPELSATVTSLVKFVKHFQWQKVAVLQLFHSKYDQVASNLELSLRSHDVDVVHEQLDLRPSSCSSCISSAICKINCPRAAIRAIFVVGSNEESRQLLCTLYRRGMHDKRKFVLIFVGPSGSNSWYSTPTDASGISADCDSRELEIALDGHFASTVLYWSHNPLFRVKFQSRLLEELKRNQEHIRGDFNEAPLAYDAVQIAHKTLMETIRRLSKPLNNEVFTSSESIFEEPEFEPTLIGTLHEIQYEGVSGEVSFSNGIRGKVSSEIIQYSGSHPKLIAYHFNSNNSFSWVSDPVLSEEGSNAGCEEEESFNGQFPLPLPNPRRPDDVESNNRQVNDRIVCNTICFTGNLCNKVTTLQPSQNIISFLFLSCFLYVFISKFISAAYLKF